jgi:hypothetical protein
MRFAGTFAGTFWTGKSGLQWSRNKIYKITKKAHTFRGQKSKWEIPDLTGEMP